VKLKCKTSSYNIINGDDHSNKARQECLLTKINKGNSISKHFITYTSQNEIEYFGTKVSSP